MGYRVPYVQTINSFFCLFPAVVSAQLFRQGQTGSASSSSLGCPWLFWLELLQPCFYIAEGEPHSEASGKSIETKKAIQICFYAIYIVGTIVFITMICPNNSVMQRIIKRRAIDDTMGVYPIQ